MAKRRDFELLDSMVPRNRAARTAEAVVVQSAVFFLTWWISKFYLREMFVKFYQPSPISENAADIALVAMSLVVTAIFFLKTIKLQAALTDPNQILIALNALGHQVMFGPGIKLKLIIDFLSSKNAVTISLEAKKESQGTTDVPMKAQTLDTTVDYSFSYSYYPLVSAVANLQLRTIGTASDNVKVLVNSAVQSCFRQLTSEEALANKDIVIMATTLLIEAKTVPELKLELFLLFRHSLWFDTEYRSSNASDRVKSERKVVLEMIRGLVRTLEHYYKDLQITDDNMCSIADSLGLVIDIVKFDSVTYPVSVQDVREKSAVSLAVRDSHMEKLGINPRDKDARQELVKRMKEMPELYSQAQQFATFEITGQGKIETLDKRLNFPQIDRLITMVEKYYFNKQPT